MISKIWIAGAILLAALIVLVVVYPVPIPGYSGFPHAGMAGRAAYVIVLSSALCLDRIIRGPTAADRIMSIDIMGILIVGYCGIMAAATGHAWFIDIGLVWALMSFIGTLALSKYLEGRAYDD